MAEIKSSTVDKVAEKIKQSNPSMSSEQARKIARDGAERVNRQSRERGK